MTMRFEGLRKLARKLRASPVPKALAGLLIFAAMVAIPLVADKVLHGAVPGQAWSIVAAILLSAIAFAVGLPWYWAICDRYDDIESCLKRAERDLNTLLATGQEHGGRKGKVVERAEWNRMARSPGTQIFNAGYRTPAHDLIDWNEKDLAGKGTAMGKATATALLFRELYEGSVETAQSRIVAEVKNGASVPYIAPGLRELIGFDKFDPVNVCFEDGAGADSDDLQLVAKRRRFPSDNLIMVKTNAAGVRTALYGNAVLIDLTEQKP